MSFEVILSASRLILAPRARVWEVFSRVTDWPSWNRQCHLAELEQGEKLAARSRLSLGLKPLGLPITVTALVLESRPGERLRWQGRLWGVESLHTYELADAPGGTLVVSEEMLSGWALLPARLIYSPKRLLALNQVWLKDLAKEAEKGS